MATVNSTLAAKQIDYSREAKAMPTDYNGRVRVARGSYTGSDAAGTVIRLCKIPKGARLLGSSRLYFEAGQNASLTVKVGDAADDDRYLAAVAPGASAAVKELSLAGLVDRVAPAEEWILLTTGAQALTADKKIVFEIFFVLD